MDYTSVSFFAFAIFSLRDKILMLAPVLKPADIPVETEVKHALWSVPVFADNNLTEHPALDEDAFPFAVYEDDHVTVCLY